MKTLLLYALLCLCLAGCSKHPNPLLTLPKTKLAALIYHAELYAADKTNFYDANGNLYKNCVLNPAHYNSPFNSFSKNPCQAFLLMMLNYLKHKTQFNHLIINDLNNKEVILYLGRTLFAYEATGGQVRAAKALLNRLNKKASSQAND